MAQFRPKRAWAASIQLLVLLASGSGFIKLADAASGSTNPIVAENQHVGSDEWQLDRPGFMVSDHETGQIKGYASTTSVNHNDSITFYITVSPSDQYTIDIYRIGTTARVGG